MHMSISHISFILMEETGLPRLLQVFKKVDEKSA